MFTSFSARKQMAEMLFPSVDRIRECFKEGRKSEQRIVNIITVLLSVLMFLVLSEAVSAQAQAPLPADRPPPSLAV